MAITPRTVVDRIKKPGLSQGERRRLQNVAKHGTPSYDDNAGGHKRNKRRAKIARASKRRNR